MGYVPPGRPSGIIILPRDAEFQKIEEWRDGLWHHPNLSAPPDFGQQWIGEPPKHHRPSTPYRRYLWDLYGASGRDWMPILNALALVLMGALVLVVAAIFTLDV